MLTMTAHSETQTPSPVVSERAASTKRTTTLYDLIAAVQDMVSPDQDDAIVVATVAALLRTGAVTWSEPLPRIWSAS